MASQKVVNIINDPDLDAWEDAEVAARERLREDYGIEDPSEGRVLREICRCYVGASTGHYEDDDS